MTRLTDFLKEKNIIMGQLNYIQTRKDAQWGFRLNDGRIIEVMTKEGRLLFRYDTPINLTTGEIGQRPEYKPFAKDEDRCPEGFTTLNILKREKKGDTVYCYDEYCIRLGMKAKVTIRKSIAIAHEFQKHGFKVTPEAVMHNYDAWRKGLKSGYRDEKNGYHLFSPCGGNPFDMRATTLEECCSDWQATYVC